MSFITQSRKRSYSLGSYHSKFNLPMIGDCQRLKADIKWKVEFALFSGFNDSGMNLSHLLFVDNFKSSQGRLQERMPRPFDDHHEYQLLSRLISLMEE